MPTVTYKNQPAIHKTRGAIPLAGTEHVYKVTKLLWPEAVHEHIRELCIGTTLHVCCGMSDIGDVRLDLFQPNIDVRASMDRLPFADKSFNTVLIDPPYNSKLQIMHDMLSELRRIANKRIIIQHWFSPVNRFGYYRKDHQFQLVELFAWSPKTYFGRMQIISVFDTI